MTNAARHSNVRVREDLERCEVCGARCPAVAPTRALAVERCTACGHRYVAPLLEDLDREARLTTRSASPAATTRRSDLEQVLEDRRKGLLHFQRDIAHLHPNGRLLDVAASTGGLLAAARDARMVVHGLERAPQLRALAATQHGLELIDSDVYSTTFTPHCFDVVVLDSVLEQTGRPSELLQWCWKMLAPNGCVVIETRDDDRLRFADEPDEDDTTLLSSPHRFTGADLARMLPRAGFFLFDLYSPSEQELVAIGAPA